MSEDEFRKGKGAVAEAVAHPAYYGGANDIYECIQVLEAWLTPEQYAGFLRGSAIKYLCRAGKKGNAVTDLRKSSWYALREAELHGKHAVRTVWTGEPP